MARSNRRQPAFDPDRLADIEDLLPPPPQADENAIGAVGAAADFTVQEPVRREPVTPAGPPTDDAPQLLSAIAAKTVPTKTNRPRTAQNPSSGSSRQAQTRGVSSGPISVAVYIPDDLKSLLEQEVVTRGRDTTYGRIAIDALVRHIDDIDARLTHERRASSPELSKTSRFSPPPQRQQRLRGPGGRQVQFRISAPEGAWLEELVTAVGAYSRSALIAEALEMELAPKKSPRN